MKRLTPEEFFNHPSCPVAWLPDEYQHLFELMQAYAEHCEESAWVADGSLPPVDGIARHGTQKSANVNILDTDSLVFEAYFDHYRMSWFAFGNAGLFGFTNVVAWRPLPSPPQKISANETEEA